MEILKSKIEWMEDWDNYPSLSCLLKDVNYDDFDFQQKGSLYWAERDGLVRFYSYSKPDEGFGGRIFKIKVNGEEKSLIGPWSSSASAMNKHFPHCFEIHYTEEESVWNRGYTFYFGLSLLIPLAKKAIEDAGGYLVNGNGVGPYDSEMSGEQSVVIGGYCPDYSISMLPNKIVKPRKRQDKIVYKNMITNEEFETLEQHIGR